jgi:hypothetical protein
MNYLEALVDRTPMKPLGGDTGAGDGATAAECLELGLRDHAVIVYLNLQLHHIAARGRTHQPRPNVRLLLIKRANIARVFVVIDDVLVVHASRGTAHTAQAAHRFNTHTSYSRQHFTRTKSLPRKLDEPRRNPNPNPADSRQTWRTV